MGKDKGEGAVQPEQSDTAPPAPAPATEQELQAKLQAALTAGDFKQVAAVSKEIVKLQSGKESAEREAKQAAVKAATDAIRTQIDTFIAKLKADGKLDAAECVKYSIDLGNEEPSTCQLLKVAPRTTRPSGGGGGGKKDERSTGDLLKQFGGEQFSDTQTFQQAWDSTTDGNFRYKVRMRLLKLADAA